MSKSRGAPVSHKSLVLALVASLVAVVGVLTLTPAGALTNCSVSADDQAVDGEEQDLLNRINQYRAQNGKAALTMDTAPTRSAAWMSRDMAAHNQFSSNHVDSLGRGVGARLTQCDVPYTRAGENLAAGNADAAATFEQWRTSPSHNSAMLDAGFTRAGVARATQPGSTYGWYWTMDLTAPAQAAPATSSTTSTTTAPTVPSPPEPTAPESAPSVAPDAPNPSLDADCDSLLERRALVRALSDQDWLAVADLLVGTQHPVELAAELVTGLTRSESGLAERLAELDAALAAQGCESASA